MERKNIKKGMITQDKYNYDVNRLFPVKNSFIEDLFVFYE